MSCVSSPKILGQRVNRFLRTRHPVKTAANVAAETDCGLHQVERWLECVAAPSGPAMVSLIFAYGPEFLASVMPESVAWLDDAVMQSREHALLEEIETRQKQLSELRKRL